jgi:hypothetical protein
MTKHLLLLALRHQLLPPHLLLHHNETYRNSSVLYPIHYFGLPEEKDGINKNNKNNERPARTKE